MSAFEEIAMRLASLERRIADQQSPWLRGDAEAAHYAGFRDRKAFRRWADSEGIRPTIRGGLNLWRKGDLK